MPPSDPPRANPTAGGAAFAATQWSVVLGGRDTPERRQAALEHLCRVYWPPIYGFLRRRGHAPADAEDLTQGFFASILESDFLERPDPARGRFRSYLLGALRHYLGSHFERLQAGKRGGGVQFIDWQSLQAEDRYAAIDSSGLDPAAAYERAWALTLLEQALQRLGEEQAAAGRSRHFAVLKSFLSAAPSRGEYDQAALALGTSRTTVAVWVHRLNARYVELVKLEVAATLQHTADAPAEMQHLLQVLRGP